MDTVGHENLFNEAIKTVKHEAKLDKRLILLELQMSILELRGFDWERRGMVTPDQGEPLRYLWQPDVLNLIEKKLEELEKEGA